MEHGENSLYQKLRAEGYKTFEEMNRELKNGLRPSITYDDILKSDELERSTYPDWIIYPEEGDVYETLSDVKVNYLTHWSAPYTGGGNTIIPKGECIKVGKIFQEKPTSTNCIPVNYKNLEELIVPYHDRTAFKYSI